MIPFQAAVVGCVAGAMLGFAFALVRDVAFIELLPRLGVLALYGGGMAAMLVWLNTMLKNVLSDEHVTGSSGLDQ